VLHACLVSRKELLEFVVEKAPLTRRGGPVATDALPPSAALPRRASPSRNGRTLEARYASFREVDGSGRETSYCEYDPAVLLEIQNMPQSARASCSHGAKTTSDLRGAHGCESKRSCGARVAGDFGGGREGASLISDVDCAVACVDEGQQHLLLRVFAQALQRHAVLSPVVLRVLCGVARDLASTFASLCGQRALLWTVGQLLQSMRMQVKPYFRGDLVGAGTAGGVPGMRRSGGGAPAGGGGGVAEACASVRCLFPVPATAHAAGSSRTLDAFVALEGLHAELIDMLEAAQHQHIIAL